MNILQTLQRRLADALTGLVEDPTPHAGMIRPAQDPRFGDFQANCAMPLAKVLGKPPRDVAAQIVERLDVADFCHPPEIAGPGFINLTLRSEWIAERVTEMAADPRLGVEETSSPRTVVVDFSSPNVAKPMHVGHLRSTVIGDAIQRVLRFLGHRVHSDNHIGDWGTQFGMIIYGYKHFLDEAAYAQEPVAELARLYRLVNTLSDYHAAQQSLPELDATLNQRQRELEGLTASAPQGDKKAAKDHKKAVGKAQAAVAAAKEATAAAGAKSIAVESDPDLQTKAAAHPDIARLSREETAKLHAGDPENRSLWDQFLPACLKALQGIYDRLEIKFDLSLGESHYQPMLADVVADLKAKGLARESDGAMCVFVEGREAPFIVQKADGAYTYATTDLATIRYRVDDLKAEEILYVVDSRQSEHFQLLFATAEKWFGADEDRTLPVLRHVSFGTVMGEDKKPYKTRSGDTVGLESLLDQAVAQARQIVDANDDAKPDGPELSEARRGEIAEIVGIGGIKYADLRHNRESDYVFSWDKMLAKTGDTATYMQYAYARTRGILRRAGDDWDQSAAIRVDEPAERGLSLKLLRFHEALEASTLEYRPNLLTQYLFELANEFSTFFEQCPVLKAEGEKRDSRLLLTDLTGRVIRQGLSLLGIGTVEQM